MNFSSSDFFVLALDLAFRILSVSFAVQYRAISIKNPPLAKNYPWSQLGDLNEKIRTPLSKIEIAREARKKKIGVFSVLQCKNTLK